MRLKVPLEYQIRGKSSPAIWRRRILPTFGSRATFGDEDPAPTFDGELVRYIHLNPLRVELVNDLNLTQTSKPLGDLCCLSSLLRCIVHHERSFLGNPKVKI
jgi:hypothetical protein